MYTKVLIAYDGSEGSKKALKTAIGLAACCGSELHSISVEKDLPQYVATIGEFDEVKRQKDAFFSRLTDEAVKEAKAGGVTLTPHVMAGNEVECIIDFCKEGGFDLLVIGFIGHSRLYERIWGGTSRTITRLAPCPVLIAK
jgi:nucleotide-binding universal stress UspA family protein